MWKEILLPVGIFVGLSGLTGILLSVFSKVFAVESDEKVDEVLGALPGLNCGVCGFTGCESYAKELVHNDAKTNRCVPGGADASKKISAILGKDYENVARMVCYVKCAGHNNATEDLYIYEGEQTCAACNLYYSGKGSCDYGCLGFGDCAAKCPNNAISIINGVAWVDEKTCVGCGICQKACPKQLIVLRDIAKQTKVKCANCDSGKNTRAVCSNGCIGCKKCEKNCPTGAIKVVNNCAQIDHELCNNCGACVEGCPVHCILIGGK